MIGRAPSIGHVWIALTVTAAFVGPASSPVGLPDLYWTLLSGDWLFSHHALLAADPFTSAPHVDGPVLNVQWLADLVFRGLEIGGGLPLVIAGTALVVAATYALLLAAAVAASSHLRLSCVAVWLAYILGASNLSPRPQTLAYPLFALFLLAIVRALRCADTRLLWLLPPATVFWANLHGSFPLGWALLGCAAVARIAAERNLQSARPYLLTLGACIMASLVNPYGPGLLTYVASIGNNAIIRDLVTEWTPTTVTSQDGMLFFASAAILAGLALVSRVRLTGFEVLALLVFGYLGWSALRGIVWWGFLSAPIVARLAGGLLATPKRAPRRDRPLVNACILAGLLTVAAFSLPWAKAALPILPANKRGLVSDDTPVRVGEYLRTHDPPTTGGMFNNQTWGGYLEWAAWPRHQVFVDGRFELYPPQVWVDYLNIVFPAAGWRSLLDRYAISYVVLSTAQQQELIADLRQAGEGAWRLDYEDDQAVVFSRTPSASP